MAIRTPGGTPVRDGYRSVIEFASNKTVKFFEKSVKFPGFDGGGGVDTTTMYNDTYRTMEPKALISTTPGSAVVAYDPAVLEEILALINVKDEITVTHPDGSTYSFWGWLSKFEFNENREGEQPTATIEFISGNTDDSFVEDDIEYTAPTGGSGT